MPITELPEAPSRSAPATFSDRADALLGALATFVSEANALEENVNAKEVLAAASAVAAAASEAVALAAANYVGPWADQTGAANVPYCVSHLGSYWQLAENLADVTAKTPGTDPEWLEIYRGARHIVMKCIPDTASLSAGDGVARVTVPAELAGMKLISVGAHVYTTSSSGDPEVQIHNETQAADMLSTTITIDAGEHDSADAATPPVIDTGNDDIAAGDVLRIDCDAAGTGTKGLEVRMGFRLP